ncbi:MAG: HAD hydrolase-like protein [Ktedonobacterales bacterium]
MDRHGIAPSQTLFVGDMDSDREAAARAGCHFMWAREYFLKREWR